MNDAYRCIISLNINDDVIKKIYIGKTISLWRELKLLVTPSAHSLEYHIISQMVSLDDGIADK